MSNTNNVSDILIEADGDSKETDTSNFRSDIKDIVDKYFTAVENNELLIPDYEKIMNILNQLELYEAKEALEKLLQFRNNFDLLNDIISNELNDTIVYAIACMIWYHERPDIKNTSVTDTKNNKGKLRKTKPIKSKNRS